MQGSRQEICWRANHRNHVDWVSCERPSETATNRRGVVASAVRRNCLRSVA